MRSTITIPATTGGDKRYAVTSTTSTLHAEATDPGGQRWTLTCWRRVRQRGFACQLTGIGPTTRSGDHGIYAGSGAITAAALLDAWPDATSPPQALADACRRHDQRHGAWLPSEDAVMAMHYPSGGADACAEHLPGRERNSIQHRAGQLGLTRSKDSSNAPWTGAEDAIIMAEYPSLGGSALARTGQLPGRTPKSIRLRAQRLSVRCYSRL